MATKRMNLVSFIDELNNEKDNKEYIVNLSINLDSHTHRIKFFDENRRDEVFDALDKVMDFSKKHKNFTNFAFLREKNNKYHFHLISKKEMMFIIKNYEKITGEKIKIERLF